MVSSVLCGWTLAADDSQLQRLPPALRLADDFDARGICQQLDQPPPCKRLVVHDQHPHVRLPAATR